MFQSSSELLGNIEEMFSRYYMHRDKCLTSSNLQPHTLAISASKVLMLICLILELCIIVDLSLIVFH